MQLVLALVLLPEFWACKIDKFVFEKAIFLKKIQIEK